jgi:hypothetical protein
LGEWDMGDNKDGRTTNELNPFLLVPPIYPFQHFMTSSEEVIKDYILHVL